MHLTCRISSSKYSYTKQYQHYAVVQHDETAAHSDQAATAQTERDLVS